MDDFFERWLKCEKCGRHLFLVPKDEETYYLYCGSCGTCDTWKKEEKKCTYGIVPTVMGDLPL